MKKYFLAIAAVMMVAGAITIVACTKDNPINNTQNTQPVQHTSSVKSNTGIAIAELTEDGIKLLFDKQKVLADIQAKFKRELDIDCIMEDIQVSTKKVDKEEVQIITIAYFDLNEEQAVSMFGLVEKKLGGKLILNYGEIFGSCRGKNCETGCKPSFFQNIYGGIVVSNCSSCKPNPEESTYNCEFVQIQRFMSDIVYECIHSNI